VILAWVISLILLCSSLVMHLEKLTTLRMIEVNTIELSQKKFMASEKAVLDCQINLSHLSQLQDNNCFIESVGRNQWRISSKEKPIIQVHVHLDEATGLVTRLNWRQVFE